MKKYFTKQKPTELHESEQYLYFKVPGAGKIKISESCNHLCSDKYGFSFGVEWGKYGFAGGVLPKEEAIKLAEHILNTLK